MVAFRDRALIGKKWDHTAGASLKTYFIGCCVYQFPNHFRRWQRDEQTWSLLRRLDPEADDPMPETAGTDTTEETVLIRLASAAAFDAVPDDRTKLAVLLQSAGYGVREIAELLTTTPKAVEMLLHRQRRRAVRTRKARGSS